MTISDYKHYTPIAGVFRAFSYLQSYFPADALDEIHNTSSLTPFNFDRSNKCVRKAEIPSEVDAPEQNFEGLLMHTHCYGRIAYHDSTKTLMLFASKNSKHLEGDKVSQDILPHIYLVAAYKTDGTLTDQQNKNRLLRERMREFNDKFSQVSSDYFTLRAGTLENGDQAFFTPYYAYLIQKNPKTAQYDVIFKDRTFEPSNISKRSKLTRIFTDVSAKIATASTYEAAIETMNRHWQDMTANTWDGKHPYDNKMMRRKGVLASIFNLGRHHAAEALAVHSAIGIGMGILSSKYTIMGGLFAAGLHTISHIGLSAGYVHASKEAKKRLKLAKDLKLDEYHPDADVSDYFRDQTNNNFSRIAPKADPSKLNTEDLSFVKLDNSGILLDHENATEDFRPSFFPSFLLSLHQREVSSKWYVLDANTELHLFQNGIVRLMHKDNETNKVRVLAAYRPAICIDDRVHLSSDRIKSFKGKTVAFDYDPAGVNFYNSCSAPKSVDADAIKREIEEMLPGKTSLHQIVEQAFDSNDTGLGWQANLPRLGFF